MVVTDQFKLNKLIENSKKLAYLLSKTKTDLANMQLNIGVIKLTFHVELLVIAVGGRVNFNVHIRKIYRLLAN